MQKVHKTIYQLTATNWNLIMQYILLTWNCQDSNLYFISTTEKGYNAYLEIESLTLLELHLLISVALFWRKLKMHTLEITHEIFKAINIFPTSTEWYY